MKKIGVRSSLLLLLVGLNNGSSEMQRLELLLGIRCHRHRRRRGSRSGRRGGRRGWRW